VPLERLQKVLAKAGIASRRKCEKLILDGRVTVDGEVVTKLGTQVDARKQQIKCDGVALKREKPVYVLLNKPRGFVCSLRPARGQKSVLSLVSGFSQRLFPVGRLDRDSEGLILVTNDGELAARLTHPRYQVSKIYKVTISGRLTDDQMESLTKPVGTSSGRMRLPEVKVTVRDRRRSELEVTLREGRNREIRRILAAKGIKVRRLVRTSIGPLRLGELQPGQFRRVNGGELYSLFGFEKDE
jgi:23S rRNA pseudouridine2605 synthase